MAYNASVIQPEHDDRGLERDREAARPLDRDALVEKVGRFPAGPGVYLLLDDRGRVIYVGKAKSLRARVRSYLREGADDGRRLFPFLARNIRDVECIATNNEKEAFILENTL